MKKNYKIKFGLIVLGFFVITGLSGQQSYTFTPCGATGSVGPSQNQVTATYSTTNLNGLVTTTTNGIQTWTVPYTGNFRIEARGAQGGTAQTSAGLGATMVGDFSLTVGEVIQILVGQQGEDGSSASAGGGGGGSFVVRTPYTTTTSVLVAAGGGSGGGSYASAPGLTTTTGGNATSGGAGGTNGSGGGGGSRAAGGGGFLTDGGPCSVSTNYSLPGEAFVNGGEGGGDPNNPTCSSTFGVICSGGFGGGGSHGGNCIPNGGAGGGYSGGGGSYNDVSAGGGSYNGGTNQTNTQGNNSGNGRVIITELCSIQIYASGSNSVNPSLCSGNSLTLTTNAVSGYSWSTGQTTSSIVIAPSTNTVYSLTGTSSLACTATGIMSVTVSSGIPVLAISNPSNNICLGRTVSLTATGALTYTWTNPGVVNGQTFTPSSTAVYTVTGQNGCGTATAITSITVAPLPVSASASPTIVCEGYATTLTALSSVNGYTWMPIGLTGSLIVASPTANSVYTVTASDGTCSGVAIVSVTTKETPTVTASGTSTMVCENASLTLSASGAQTYSWIPVNQSGQSIVVNPTVSTNYQVAGTNSVGCTAYASWVVVVNQAPLTTASSNKAIVCAGASVVLTAGGASSYNWVGGPSTAGYTVNPQAAAVYTVSGMGQNGCTKNATVSVNVYQPVLTLGANASGVCPGGNLTLNASTSGANTYSWNGIPGSSIFVVSPTVTTVYNVSANSATPGVTCPVSKTIQVTVFPLPTVTITANKSQLCKNESPALLTAGGASTYVWINTSASTHTVNSSVLNTITYSVMGKDANGCEGTATFKVTVNPCTGIAEEQKLNNGLNIFPNPNNGEFLISSKSDVDLKLINELGQEVKVIRLTAENQRQVSLNGIASGIYFITGKYGDTQISHRIIVNK